MGRQLGSDGRIRNIGFSDDWVPANYSVDASGKVVGGYSPDGPHNWGRWGDLDQKGTANLIGKSEVLGAARLIETGEVFSLTHPIAAASPRWPGRPAPMHTFTVSGSDVVCGNPALEDFHFQYTDDVISMAMQDATQWDALGHAAVQDVQYNGFWVGNITADRGARRLGIENASESLVGRGVLVDLPRFLGVDALEPRFIVTTDLLDRALAGQGVTLEPGDMLLYRTGHLSRWRPSEMSVEEKMAWFVDSPRFDPNGCGWLRDHDVAALCCDTNSPDGVPTAAEFAAMGPHDTSQPTHVNGIVALGLMLGELFDLERLAQACAADGRYAFFLCAPPLNVPGAVGSPMNPIAIR